MKVTTWNVNGIRARYSQVVDWLAREQPDVVCLQELKATAAEVPGTLCDLSNYWWYWHGNKGYSGVGLGVKKTFAPACPTFFHPAFDRESRIVAAQLGPATVASVYVPNGGKDLAAKLRFLEAMDGFALAGARPGRAADPVWRLQRRPHRPGRAPKERKPGAVGQLPEERAWLGPVAGARPGRPRPGAGPRQ